MQVRRITAMVLALALMGLAAAPIALAYRGIDAFHDDGGGGGGGGTTSVAGTVRLMAVGDVMLAQTIGRRVRKKGPLAPCAKVNFYFDEADLVVANLECTISERGTKWNKTFTFRAPLAAANSLA